MGLETLTADLYAHIPPPGRPIPIEVYRFPVYYNIPGEEDIDKAVQRLRLHCAGGPSGMRAEHLSVWLCAATWEEQPDPGNWEKFISIIQAAFRVGELVVPCAWQTVVIIPKGGGTDFRGIGLVELLWKTISGIINRRISSSIQFHDAMYGFRVGRGTGTATLEEKLLQQLITIRETVLHSIFLDLIKAYDSLDRDRCIDILIGYGVGPRIIHILQTYWIRLQMAEKAGGHYRPVFQIHRGVIQGDPLLPTIFNVVVDAVIRHWVTVLGWGGQEGAIQVLGTSIQTLLMLFYANDGLVALPESTRLQGAFDALMGLFKKVGLRTNEGKTVSMACRSCHTPHVWSTEAYTCQVMVRGIPYRERLC